LNQNIKQISLISIAIISTSLSLFAGDLTKAYDMPDGKKIFEKDFLDKPTKYTLPKTCNLDDKESIARGKYLFHNINGGTAKGDAPKGLKKWIETKDKNGKVIKVAKDYGNCIACHDIENSIGGGTIGPKLVDYQKTFIKTGARDAQFVYQKIADPRIDLASTNMTINLASKLINEQDTCDITAYVVSTKAVEKKTTTKK